MLTQKEHRDEAARYTQDTLLLNDYGCFSAKTQLGPVLGSLGPKRVLENGQKWPEATGRMAVVAKRCDGAIGHIKCQT